MQSAPVTGSDSASQAWRQNTADVTKQGILSQVRTKACILFDAPMLMVQISAITAATASIVTLTSVGQGTAFEVRNRLHIIDLGRSITPR